MIVTMPAGAGQLLAELALTETRRHPPRTPQRQSAAHLWAALTDTKTADAARRAIRTFGDQQTQDDATRLLGQLTTQIASHNPDQHHEEGARFMNHDHDPGLADRDDAGRVTLTSALPPPETRARAAASVHQAICDFGDSNLDYARAYPDGIGLCALYAYTGAALACQVTGRQDYRPEAGSLVAMTGGSVLRTGPEAARRGGPGFHAWITGPGSQVADFTMRHYPAMARLADPAAPEWDCTNWPPYYWGTRDDLLDLGVTLAPDTRIRDAVLADPATRLIARAVSLAAADYLAGRTKVRRPWRAVIPGPADDGHADDNETGTTTTTPGTTHGWWRS